MCVCAVLCSALLCDVCAHTGELMRKRKIATARYRIVHTPLRSKDTGGQLSMIYRDQGVVVAVRKAAGESARERERERERSIYAPTCDCLVVLLFVLSACFLFFSFFSFSFSFSFTGWAAVNLVDIVRLRQLWRVMCFSLAVFFVSKQWGDMVWQKNAFLSFENPSICPEPVLAKQSSFFTARKPQQKTRPFLFSFPRRRTRC
jgi:hypothetical protein